MSVLETLFVFAFLPALGMAVAALFVYLPSLRRQQRYRPGRPWTYEPVWYVASDSPQVTPAGPGGQSGRPVLGSSPARAELTSGHEPAGGASTGVGAVAVSTVTELDERDETARTARGGARGTW